MGCIYFKKNNNNKRYIWGIRQNMKYQPHTSGGWGSFFTILYWLLFKMLENGNQDRDRGVGLSFSSVEGELILIWTDRTH